MGFGRERRNSRYRRFRLKKVGLNQVVLHYGERADCDCSGRNENVWEIIKKMASEKVEFGNEGKPRTDKFSKPERKITVLLWEFYPPERFSESGRSVTFSSRAFRRSRRSDTVMGASKRPFLSFHSWDSCRENHFGHVSDTARSIRFA